MSNEIQIKASTLLESEDVWPLWAKFQPSEFVGWLHDPKLSPTPKESMLSLLDIQTLYVLFDFRERLNGRIVISPAPGTIARDYKQSSQHYVGTPWWDSDESEWNGYTRLSKAIDFFLLDNSTRDGYEILESIEQIGGIGVYPDWELGGKRFPALHMDTRPRKKNNSPALWMTRKGIGTTGIQWNVIDL